MCSSDLKASSPIVNYTEEEEVDIGQETYYKSKNKTKYITMKDNSEMMGIVNAFNKQYAVPYRKNVYLANKYGK